MTPLVEKVAKAIEMMPAPSTYADAAEAAIEAARPDILREAAAVARNVLNTRGAENIAIAIERLADGLERIRQP